MSRDFGAEKGNEREQGDGTEDLSFSRGSLVDETSLQGLADGRHQIKETQAGAKIMVHIVDGKLASYEAQDEAGYPLPLFFIQERRPISSAVQFSGTLEYEDVCHSCVGGGFVEGEVYCYNHECVPDDVVM